jgi:hypothetical protein
MAEEREQSKIHRFEVGDKVSLTTEGHDELEMQDEGEVVAFANDEMTYLTVDFDGDEYDLTEDELRRLSA